MNVLLSRLAGCFTDYRQAGMVERPVESLLAQRLYGLALGRPGVGVNTADRYPQHLRIKAFFGTAENAVKTQIWTAISVYVLVAIIKKRLKLTTELYTILQILSLTLFEKVPLYQLLTQTDYKTDHRDILNQLNLFN